MGRMRLPSLSLHGIEGSAVGKTAIPANVTGTFSIRLVPPQTPENIVPLVISYIESEFAKLGSKNTLVVQAVNSGEPWVADMNHWNSEAVKQATRQIYTVEDMTREGGSIPVVLTFADTIGVNIVLLPMGRGDDGIHSTNEKLDRSSFVGGSKLMGAYLYEL